MGLSWPDFGESLHVTRCSCLPANRRGSNSVVLVFVPLPAPRPLGGLKYQPLFEQEVMMAVVFQNVRHFFCDRGLD